MSGAITASPVFRHPVGSMEECPVCSSEHRELIESLYGAGISSFRELADRVGCELAWIEGHFIATRKDLIEKRAKETEGLYQQMVSDYSNYRDPKKVDGWLALAARKQMDRIEGKDRPDGIGIGPQVIFVSAPGPGTIVQANNSGEISLKTETEPLSLPPGTGAEEEE